MTATFVNPYTFVPLPASDPQRATPHGHLGTAGLLSGQLGITITAESPLLVRGLGEDSVPTRPARTGDGREQIIPGSGLHGAVRSLHEALTRSCLRVFHGDFVPVYRQQADVHQVKQLRLGVVTEAPAAAKKDEPPPPPTVRMCESGDPENDRIGQETLQRLHATTGGGLRSGTRLERAIDDGWTVDPQGSWVVFISDDKARDHGQRYRAHARELSHRHVTVPEGPWDDFLHVVKGADDLRPEQVKDDGGLEQRWKEVTYAHEPRGGPTTDYTVGMRSLARKTVEVGQPLWLRFEDEEVTEVRLAQIWRMPGRIAASRRVGGFGPCTGHAQLCPSCWLFGSADTSGADDGAAQQRSYRGHVRFSDAVVTAPARLTKVQLPPLGQPRPGAGQFYLQNSPADVGNGDKPVPLRQWGSSADGGEPRRIRGRKFYWHTPPQFGQLPARGVARPHHQGSPMSSTAMLYPAGTVFTATVTFVDIDEAQLGALFAALNPAGLLGRPDALVSLGGGRPLGYGSCKVTLSEERSRVWRSEHRYSTGESVPLDALRRDCEVAVRASCRDLKSTWEYLAAALSPQTVADEQVWYPPGTGRPGSEGYDEGYEFWKQTTGYELRPSQGRTGRWGHPLTPLPDALEKTQTLPVVGEAQNRPLSDGKDAQR